MKRAVTKKPVRVNRKFLNDLADRIFNPKTKQFLRLCNGRLQNGHDPTDVKRLMHCGLGELYYTMTGLQPADTNVRENEIVNKAVELSTLKGRRQAAMLAMEKRVKTAKLPESIEEAALNEIKNLASDDLFETEAERKFRVTLDAVARQNDNDGAATATGTDAEYRARSKRVAFQLRKAATFLPK